MPRSASIALALLAVTAVGVASLAGCSRYKLESPPKLPIEPFFQPPSALAQVCVMRPSNLALAVTFVVKDNGKLVGATRGPTYFCYYAAPGPHVITSDSGDDVAQATLEAKAGGRYYLEQGVENIFGFVKSPLSWVADSEAKSDLESCDYNVLVGVPGTETLPGPVPIASAR